jgi:diguanylate cyclase (GGDEF)-like protein
LVVLSTNVIYLQGWIEITNVDLTPMGFSFALLLFTWVILKDNLLQLVPIARSVLFDEMDDALIVLNEYRRVVDINPTAQILFQDSTAQPVGKLLLDLFDGDIAVKKIMQHRYSEITIGDKSWQVLRTELRVNKNTMKGTLIVLRDISQLKKTQTGLIKAQQELSEANQRLQYLADTDTLTKLFNRRVFFEKLTSELNRCIRYRHCLCLLVIDLDYFKRINDQYGHLVGDDVLVNVAETLRDTARNIDTVGRIGGEEFCIILAETDLDGGQLFAERLRQSIQDSSPREGLTVTASIGLACSREIEGCYKSPAQEELMPDSVAENDGQHISQSQSNIQKALFERADKALYRSKNEGRNRVSVSD